MVMSYISFSVTPNPNHGHESSDSFLALLVRCYSLHGYQDTACFGTFGILSVDGVLPPPINIPHTQIKFARLRHELQYLQLHHTLAKRLEKWVPDATEQDIREGNSTCCICFDEMVPEEKNAKKLYPCNHLFHSKCIMMWLNRSLRCPYCRTKIRRARTKKKRESDKQQPDHRHRHDTGEPPCTTPAHEPRPPRPQPPREPDPFIEFHAEITAAHHRLIYRLAVTATANGAHVSINPG
eukprot:TRINITY_DN1595_c0_g1_i3.p1 TRINITY_DN1595_c0_g1~~TRINITY_DN1595_c0_g1_i3.p1  ORF type:complete len:238 (+),score=14.50 TRINITY_DN1595_c0_g1_i3:170-883(+)